MLVFDSLEAIPERAFSRGTAVVIGKFDGVHRGHRALIEGVAEVAEARGLEPLVFTFTNNPLSLLRPEFCPQPLMSPRQRLEVLEALGVQSCVMVPFDEAFAAIPAEEFVERTLVERLRARHISVGADFRFGRYGAGDPELLAGMGQRLGFSVQIIGDIEDPVLGRVSSTRIREAILQGDVARAARMLGRPVSLRGEVVHGDARGRELGFPTANLGAAEGAEIEGMHPADGVYAGWATVDGERHRAAISVGANVTFDPEGEPRVEAYLLDFDRDIYGHRMELQFVERLRGMVAFPSVDALLVRMREDVRETSFILAGH